MLIGNVIVGLGINAGAFVKNKKRRKAQGVFVNCVFILAVGSAEDIPAGAYAKNIKTYHISSLII